MKKLYLLPIALLALCATACDEGGGATCDLSKAKTTCNQDGTVSYCRPSLWGSLVTANKKENKDKPSILGGQEHKEQCGQCQVVEGYKMPYGTGKDKTEYKIDFYACNGKVKDSWGVLSTVKPISCDPNTFQTKCIRQNAIHYCIQAKGSQTTETVQNITECKQCTKQPNNSFTCDGKLFDPSAPHASIWNQYNSKNREKCDPACTDGKVCKDGACVVDNSNGKKCEPACADGETCENGKCKKIT